jgi:4-amino-4-deoxy-L-arabinose transferase-like glycosyltransferase
VKEVPPSVSNFVGAKKLFVIVVLIGFGLRIGYGVVRYGRNLIHLSGREFINSWDHDALDHILIANALLSGKGYIVDNTPLKAGRQVHYAGQPALYKAPFYEFFLAAVFAVSGFSFKLLFPLQALLGGLLSGFVALISLQVFRRQDAAWFAGTTAAIHPILVNSASQPYNENLFFFLFTASIWLFLVWWDSHQLHWAVPCGAVIGLCTLTRESGWLLLAAMGAMVLVRAPSVPKTWTQYGVIVLTTAAVVAPWTLRNYLRVGVLVPVAAIMWTDFVEGNNACTASEGTFIAYWAEGACPSVEMEMRPQLEAAASSNPRVPMAVLRNRVSRYMAARFVSQHPGVYAKLVLRRFWTTLLPYDPRGDQRWHERVALFVYWLLLFPAGLSGLLRALTPIEPKRALLALLIVLNVFSIAAVLYWSDLRFRVGIDLLLACFAGWLYAELFEWCAHGYRRRLAADPAAGHGVVT